MVEVFVAGFFSNVFFQLVDGAGGLDGLDAPAFGADEVVAMDSGEKEDEVGGSLVEAESTNHAFFGEALQEPKDGRVITGF